MVQDQPCDYMLDKLDEFLMSLEKWLQSKLEIFILLVLKIYISKTKE